MRYTAGQFALDEKKAVNRVQTRDYIARAFPDKNRSHLKAFFLSGDSVTEARQIYLPLGFSPENIYAAELNPDAYSRAQADNETLTQPIQLFNEDAVDVVGREKLFDVLSLDFEGQYGGPISKTLSGIFGNPLARSPEHVAYVALQGRRDSRKARKRLSTLPTALMEGISHQANAAVTFDAHKYKGTKNPFSFEYEAILDDAERLLGFEYDKTVNAAVRAALVSEVAALNAFAMYTGKDLDELLDAYRKFDESAPQMTEKTREYLNAHSYQPGNTSDALVLATAIGLMPNSDEFQMYNEEHASEFAFNQALGSFPRDVEKAEYTSISGTPMTGFRAHFKPSKLDMDEEWMEIFCNPKGQQALREISKIAESQEPEYALFRSHIERVQPKTETGLRKAVQGFRAGDKFMHLLPYIRPIVLKSYQARLGHASELLKLESMVADLGVDILEAKAELQEKMQSRFISPEKVEIAGYLPHNPRANLDEGSRFRQPTLDEEIELKEMKWDNLGLNFAKEYFAETQIPQGRIAQLYNSYKSNPLNNTESGDSRNTLASEGTTRVNNSRDLTESEISNLETLTQSYDLEGVYQHFAFADPSINLGEVRHHYEAIQNEGKRTLTREEKAQVRDLIQEGLSNDEIRERIGDNVRPASVNATIARARHPESWEESTQVA